MLEEMFSEEEVTGPSRMAIRSASHTNKAVAPKPSVENVSRNNRSPTLKSVKPVDGIENRQASLTIGQNRSASLDRNIGDFYEDGLPRPFNRAARMTPTLDLSGVTGVNVAGVTSKRNVASFVRKPLVNPIANRRTKINSNNTQQS